MPRPQTIGGGIWQVIVRQNGQRELDGRSSSTRSKSIPLPLPQDPRAQTKRLEDLEQLPQPLLVALRIAYSH